MSQVWRKIHMESKTFQVPAIGCDGCVRTIVSEVGEIAGVSKVEGDVNSKQVTVMWGTPASWEQIEAKLVEIEYAPAMA
jgi:copper chaperone CopZ